MSEKQKFGRYEVQRVLGRGGMGIVYLAVDPVIDRTVAIKEVRVDQIDNATERTELEARFKLEYRSAGTLSHNNIVTIYDVVEDGGAYYIAMEYVEGMSLAHRLKAEPRPPLKEVCGLSIQIASGLDYAHRRDIVHRDIKPANVLLTQDGHPKITDFGLAKWRTSELTMTGTVLGTPAFMSPEQVMGKPVDGRSDQFSFAIILYLMLTGEQPFPAEHPSTILYKIVHEQPPDPRELNEDLPEAVGQVVLKGLAKQPENRYSSCSELAKEVAAALSGKPTSPPRSSTSAPSSGASQKILDTATPSAPAGRQHAATADVQLRAATPTPRQRRQGGRGGARWLLGAFFIAAIGGLAFWASSLRQQSAPATSSGELTVVEESTEPPVQAHLLTVQAGPEGAVIRVDGEDTELTVPADLPLSGEVGTRVKVEVVAQGTVLGARELELGIDPPEAWIEELTLPPVPLRITSAPTGAAIRLGGQNTGLVTPAEIELTPGVRNALELRLAGHDAKRWSFTIEELSEEQRSELHFRLVPSVPPGFLTINAPYPVSLQIAGRRHGPLTQGEVPTTPGTHKVVLLAADVFLRQTTTVEIKSGERKGVRIPKAVAVRITANPANCVVTVDGIEVGATPIINRRMVVGSHEFQFYWPAEGKRKTVRKTVQREGQRISETYN